MWRSKAVAHMALLRDEYPPFGDGEYAVAFSIGEAPVARDRLSVGLRFLYLIPHAIALFFIGIACPSAWTDAAYPRLRGNEEDGLAGAAVWGVRHPGSGCEVRRPMPGSG